MVSFWQESCSLTCGWLLRQSSSNEDFSCLGNNLWGTIFKWSDSNPYHPSIQSSPQTCIEVYRKTPLDFGSGLSPVLSCFLTPQEHTSVRQHESFLLSMLTHPSLTLNTPCQARAGLHSSTGCQALSHSSGWYSHEKCRWGSKLTYSDSASYYSYSSCENKAY